MPTLPTIAVYHSDGRHKLIINESDFNPSTHRLWVESSQDPASPPPAPLSPVAPPSTSPESERRKELESMGWRDLKEISEQFIPPITKEEIGSAQVPPVGEEDVRWDMSIDLIISREFSGG